MVIVQDFEKHKYNLPVQAKAPGSSIHGAGIIDTVKCVAHFVSQNKDTFKDISIAFSSVSKCF